MEVVRSYTRHILKKHELRQDSPRPGESIPTPMEKPPVEDEDALFGLRDAVLISSKGFHGRSSVAMRENGCIELFAGRAAGIRIDPNGKIVLIADKMVLAATTLEIATAPDGIVWNGEVPFQKPSLQGTTATGIPVTVFAHSPSDPMGRPAKGILAVAPSANPVKSVEQWLAEVLHQ